MDKKNILNFAIIGAGNITGDHISALEKVEGANVAYICGRNDSKLQELASKHNILWTTDYKEILNNPEIDVVDITLPSGLHAEYGIEAAIAGKHVVVEKPIDVTLKKAEALIRTCNEQGVTLGVISQMRFSDGMQKIYSYLADGKLGEIIQCDAYVKWYRSQEYYDSGEWRGTKKLDGGGAFINQGIHFIDLLLSVMGPAKRISAKIRTVNHDNIEVEDIGMAMVEFANGAHGVIQASTALYPGIPARLELHGTKGTIIYEGDGISFEHIEGAEPFSYHNSEKGGASDPRSLDGDVFIREFENIVSAIQNEHEPMVSGDEAYRALQLILAIYKSSDSGQPVDL